MCSRTCPAWCARPGSVLFCFVLFCFCFVQCLGPAMGLALPDGPCLPPDGPCRPRWALPAVRARAPRWALPVARAWAPRWALPAVCAWAPRWALPPPMGLARGLCLGSPMGPVPDEPAGLAWAPRWARPTPRCTCCSRPRVAETLWSHDNVCRQAGVRLAGVRLACPRRGIVLYILSLLIIRGLGSGDVLVISFHTI